MTTLHAPAAAALEASRPEATAPDTGETRLPMTYDEFLTEIDQSKHAEWVDGEAIIFMPPGKIHQQILLFLAELLNMYSRRNKLGTVLIAPFEMKITPESNSREPDILFVATEHGDRLTEKRLEGAADLIVEVISPESVYRDRSDKFDEYEAAGVREYWLVDARPGKERADFWVLDESSRYRAAPANDNGVYHSSVLPGFWLRVDWLWAEEQPSPLLAFAEIAGLPQEVVDLLAQTETES